MGDITGTKRPHDPKPTTLTWRQANNVTIALYGSTTERNCKRLLSAVNTCTEVSDEGTQYIEISQYLNLALLQYHNSTSSREADETAVENPINGMSKFDVNKQNNQETRSPGEGNATQDSTQVRSYIMLLGQMFLSGSSSKTNRLIIHTGDQLTRYFCLRKA